MQRSLNAGVYRYELIASRDGTHVMVIAANGHNQQVEGAILATNRPSPFTDRTNHWRPPARRPPNWNPFPL